MKAIIAIAMICSVQAFNLFKAHKLISEVSDGKEWPNVQFPYNFLIEGGYFTFNEETKELEPY